MENKKLRVLVADDEYWIRENLRTVIDWDALGLELAPMATDGEDALAKMEESPADIVITEYGIAYLRGRSVRERVQNLIAVAHPDYREELRREARRLHYI